MVCICSGSTIIAIISDQIQYSCENLIQFQNGLGLTIFFIWPLQQQQYLCFLLFQAQNNGSHPPATGARPKTSFGSITNSLGSSLTNITSSISLSPLPGVPLEQVMDKSMQESNSVIGENQNLRFQYVSSTVQT